MVKQKRMKAITPVIALVMLMLITVGIVGIAYSWFSGIFSSQTKNSILIPPGGALCVNNEIKVYVLNNGDSALTDSKIITADVDGTSVLRTPFFGNMNTGLIGYWKFDEGTGTAVTDSSGSAPAFTGVLTNMDPATDWVAGEVGKALDFEGTGGSSNDVVIETSSKTDNLVEAAASPAITSSFILSAWIYPRSLGEGPSEGRIADKGVTVAPVAAGWWFFRVDTAATPRLSFSSDYATTDLFRTSADNAITLNQWQHVMVVWNTSSVNGRDPLAAANVKFYVNGKETGYGTSTNAVGARVTDATRIFKIGNDYSTAGTKTFDGMVDEVKVYKSKTIGDFTVQPGGSGLAIAYPASAGRHTVRLGTSSGVAESTVTCA